MQLYKLVIIFFFYLCRTLCINTYKYMMVYCLFIINRFKRRDTDKKILKFLQKWMCNVFVK